MLRNRARLLHQTGESVDRAVSKSTTTMGQLLNLVKIQLILVVLCMATPTASPIKCFKCRSDAILNITCAGEYQAVDCGLDPNGRSYNACYSRNQTHDYPAIGLRSEQDKGCAFHGRECDFLRLIMCHDADGFMRSCFLTCCVEDYCNQGILSFPMEPTTMRKDATARTLSITTNETTPRKSTITTEPTAASSSPLPKTFQNICSIVIAILFILISI